MSFLEFEKIKSYRSEKCLKNGAKIKKGNNETLKLPLKFQAQNYPVARGAWACEKGATLSLSISCWTIQILGQSLNLYFSPKSKLIS